MANFIGAGYSSVPGDTASIDAAKRVPLGTQQLDVDGNEYVYLQGVASTVAKDAVTFDEVYLTTRLAANGVGPVAIAMAAVLANQFGWYCVRGTVTGTSSEAIVDNKALFATATAGAVNDGAVTGDLIYGLFSRSAPSGAGNVTLQLTYPFVTDVAGASL